MSPKSEIRIQWIIELTTDFDEILWRAGVWPRDQLITFWDDPHHYPDSGGWPDGLLVRKQSPIQVVTWPSVD